MPKWNETNKEAVEMYAIELRHQLVYYFQHRVQYPITAEEYVRYEAPPPAKDPNADRLTCPEETLTPEERRTNILEDDMTASLASELKEVSKNVRISTENTNMSEDDETPEPMDVEDDAVYAKRYDDDMEISGSDKTEAETMAKQDWSQLGATQKSKSNQEKFVRGATKTYQRARRSDYVKECRTEMQKRKRDWKKAKQQEENRVRMPETPPQEQEQEEETPKSRLTQSWWFEQDLGAVHYHVQRAHDGLSEAMANMENVKTHQFAKLSSDGESVAMAPIRKNMTMSMATTQALAATVTVVPCLKGGENGFEDSQEWKETMEEHSVADSDRNELVREARQKDLAQATTEGRVYVAVLDADRVKSAEQARAAGKAILMWCAGRETETQILPDGMVRPDLRTPEHLQEILECWLEHGELSIVARRKKARYQDKYKRTDRQQENPPWMVTMCLSGVTVTVRRLHSKREKLGKMVGRIALGFQMRDAPLHITRMMKEGVRLWQNRDQEEKKRKRTGEPTPNHKPRGATFNAANKMSGGGAGARADGTTVSTWGPRPPGGWTREQERQWEEEEQARQERTGRMHKRVERELEEIKRNPQAVSRKTERQIQRMGVAPNRDVVDKVAAKIIAYRKQMGSKEGDQLFQDKALHKAVRTQVEEYEARK
jgi:hypothetical protein